MSEAERLLNQIRERVTDIVYHSTYPKYLAQILDKDAFRLTAVPASDDDELFHQKKGAFYYLSLSRTPNIPNFDGLGVRIVLDGQKLSQRYSGGPINYFKRHSKRNRDTFEYEDRVFSNKPWLENASSYIKEIHILPKPTQDLGTGRNAPKYIVHCWMIAKQKGIPFYVYRNLKDFKLLTRKNTLTPEKFKRLYMDIRPKEFEKSYVTMNDRKTIEAWVELLRTPVNQYGRLSNSASVYLGSYMKGFSHGKTVDEMIERYRREEDVHKLIDAMHRVGVRSGDEMVRYLIKKWRDAFMKKGKDDPIIIYNFLRDYVNANYTGAPWWPTWDEREDGAVCTVDGVPIKTMADAKKFVAADAEKKKAGQNVPS